MTKYFAYLSVAVAAASALVAGLPAAHAAAFGSMLRAPAASGLVQPVGDAGTYPDDYDDGSDTQVRAPFTSVDTNKQQGTQVEAPFTSVQTDDRGPHVRAPFVDLFVPRRD